MLSEDQFFKMMKALEESRSNNLREVIGALLPAREDRDMLITIKANQESQIRLLSSMRSEDLEKIAKADSKAAAAHTRVDAIGKWVFGAIIFSVGGIILTALALFVKMGGIR